MRKPRPQGRQNGLERRVRGMNFEVKKDGKALVNGVEIEYNSYSVNFNSIDGPEVVIRFFADDVNIEHLHSVFTRTESQT